MPASIVLQSRLIGPMAGAVLRRAERLETVSAYARSFYAGDREGNLICFVKDGLEPGPLNILCGGWPEQGARGIVEPGGALLPAEGEVWAGAGITIRCAGSAVWAPPLWPEPDAESITAGLRRFRALPVSMVPDASVAKLFFGGSADTGAPRATSLESAILAEISRIAGFLRGWLRSRPHVFSPRVLSPLGLGIGLTPSGDDFIGGMLLAMRAAGMEDAVRAIGPHIPEYAKRRTNPVSASHLAAAAKGFGAEALHNFVIELMRGGECMPAAAGRLGNVGHSSGWDAAAGAVLVLECFEE